MWKELTGTETPFNWADTYSMPIMAMVPDLDSEIARKAFSTINTGKNDFNAIASAKDYISKMPYVDKLTSKEARDKAFVDAFLKDYEVLFEGVDSIKDYLKAHITEQPYYWLENKTVTSKIRDLARVKYMETGYSKAKKAIDDMPAEKVKDYLKQLIEDNVLVGVEIMKSNM